MLCIRVIIFFFLIQVQLRTHCSYLAPTWNLIKIRREIKEPTELDATNICSIREIQILLLYFKGEILFYTRRVFIFPTNVTLRLLGPDDPHLANVLSANNLLNGPELIRENARVVVMDNYGLVPPNEEQIDFVDQSGYLFGPSLAATLSHIPPVLHWWNIESKLLDFDSANDAVIYVCNKLLPCLINKRNEELRNKKAKEREDALKKPKPKIQSPPFSLGQEPEPVYNFPPSESRAGKLCYFFVFRD